MSELRSCSEAVQLFSACSIPDKALLGAVRATRARTEDEIRAFRSAAVAAQTSPVAGPAWLIFSGCAERRRPRRRRPSPELPETPYQESGPAGRISPTSIPFQF